MENRLEHKETFFRQTGEEELNMQSFNMQEAWAFSKPEDDAKKVALMQIGSNRNIWPQLAKKIAMGTHEGKIRKIQAEQIPGTPRGKSTVEAKATPKAKGTPKAKATPKPKATPKSKAAAKKTPKATRTRKSTPKSQNTPKPVISQQKTRKTNTEIRRKGGNRKPKEETQEEAHAYLVNPDYMTNPSPNWCTPLSKTQLEKTKHLVICNSPNSPSPDFLMNTPELLSIINHELAD